VGVPEPRDCVLENLCVLIINESSPALPKELHDEKREEGQQFGDEQIDERAIKCGCWKCKDEL
jgi:hypothetical protein